MYEKRGPMNNKKILCGLIGLVGAVSNNQKTDNTDSIIITALLSEDSEDAIAKIHREKYLISPNCETCQTPCGNTSDYDINAMDKWPKEMKLIKNEIFESLVNLAQACKSSGQLPKIAYKAIAYLGYELDMESYKKILEELKKW